MNASATWLLMALVSAALVSGGYECYQWGASDTERVWQARQAEAEKAAANALLEETRRADKAAADYLRNHQDQEQRYADLKAAHDDLLRRHPLVVPRAVARVATCATSEQAHARVHAPVAAQPAPAVEHAAPDADSHLTFAAVRVWNGALTGAHTTTGACGTADTSAPTDATCAQDAGVTLRDAWDNHAVNAKSCAEDRQRYQALIDFLQNKEGE